MVGWDILRRGRIRVVFEGSPPKLEQDQEGPTTKAVVLEWDVSISTQTPCLITVQWWAWATAASSLESSMENCTR